MTNLLSLLKHLTREAQAAGQAPRVKVLVTASVIYEGELFGTPQGVADVIHLKLKAGESVFIPTEHVNAILPNW